ncbi:hypothetical protein OE88DRAFT_1731873 [Heliocybe sulcata]|uniref:Globin-sensor domain-containing protein n=1 Tax=Heliocybe sulcata TaxID=5364 RepID=A0A5C3NH98_9AGAM|nr:hypothetical protein OE88DRAFT_1731873 [Heliocybe sulcata]
MSKITHIDPRSLSDLTARVHYLKSFIQFTDEDGAAVQAAGPLLSQLLPAILDAVYSHLLSFDITAKAFLPKQPEQDAAGAGAQKVEELSLEHPNIKHRKDFLGQYFVKLVSNKDWSDASPFWRYLDLVGVMHTGEPGFKHRAKRPELRVEFIHMGLLLGWVEDLVAKTVLEEESLDLPTKTKVIRAFNKLLWIQNDLFARHYVVDPATGTLPKGSQASKLLLATSSNSTYAIAGSVALAVGATVLLLRCL